MRAQQEGVSSERGVGLIMAILVLLVLSLLTIVMMSSVNTDTKITGHSVGSAHALNDAESGISEACAMLRAGTFQSDGSNPRAVGQVFLVQPGSVPVPGNADSTFTFTHQPNGAWLNYSSSSRGPDVLTVQYLTDPAHTVVYRYDPTLTPPINTATGLPVLVITSSGHSGRDVRRIQAQVIVKPIVANVKAALAANVDISFIGNAVVCGYNHKGNTPNGTGNAGRGNAPDCIPWETGSGNLPGSWTTGSSNANGASGQTGSPVDNLQGQVGFYNGPWEALGMTQAQYTTWLGAPQSSPGNINGIVNVDNNAVMGDQSTSLSLQGASGTGFLYVDGDLTINAGFNYTGLIYVEGDLKMNGQAWILGGIIVRGRSSITQNGGATILYSSDAITQALSEAGGQYVTIAWKEL
jgi:hypothetical protein